MKQKIRLTGKTDGKKIHIEATLDTEKYKWTSGEARTMKDELLDELHAILKQRFYVREIRLK